MTELLTLDEINSKVVERTEYLVIDKKDKIAVVFDRNILFKHGEEKIRRIYRMEDGKYKLVDLNAITKEVVSIVTAKVKMRDLIDDVVRTTPPEVLLEAFERLQHPHIKAKTTAGKHCYGIMIPGTRGKKPIELVLRTP